MIQEIIMASIFSLAVFFICRKIFKEFTAKDGCTGGCSQCDLPKSKSI